MAAATDRLNDAAAATGWMSDSAQREVLTKQPPPGWYPWVDRAEAHEPALRQVTQCHSRARSSHRARPGHRRVASSRAGPDDGPGEPPAPLWRHPRYGLVNDAMAAFLEAWT